ncbi:MAG: hypothetical protein KDC38_02620, partial [Planctomycetes bacterium]|nr:hypothetical protein [Planctomycetota bacterium]
DVESQVGIRLTENFAMSPAASVCGIYFAHPEANYFGVGKVRKDQIVDYAKRKKMDETIVERWLAPSLDYETEAPLPEGPPPLPKRRSRASSPTAERAG